MKIGILNSLSYNLLINLTNVAIPVLLTPFYIQQFGISGFGVLSLCFAFANYVSTITDYSWATRGPAKIIEFKFSKRLLSDFISNAFVCKFVLIIPTLIALIVVILSNKTFKSDLLLSFSLLCLALGRFQNAHWIFIGINKLKIYFLINFIIKIILILSIFSFGKHNKIWLINVLLGISDLSISVLSYIFLLFKGIFTLKKINIHQIITELSEGSTYVASNFLSTSLINSNTIILSYFFEPSLLGIFGVAEKIILLQKHSMGVLFQGIYPLFCGLFNQNKSSVNSFVKNIHLSFISIYGFLMINILFFSNTIVAFFTTDYIPKISVILRFLSVSPLIASFYQVPLMYFYLFKPKVVSNAYMIAFFVNLILMISGVVVLGLYGAVLSMVFTETFIAFYLNKYSNQTGLKLYGL